MPNKRTFLVAAAFILSFLLIATNAKARDVGQWPDNEVSRWYRSLMMPDYPTTPCCGESDAYWCDDYYQRGDKAYCRITDDRPDEPLGRPHVPVGTEIEIPPHKLKFSDGNPTGHHIVFLSFMGHALCFVQGAGT